MTLPKFIITIDGVFRLDQVNQHKHLLKPGDQCIGGGYYHFAGCSKLTSVTAYNPTPASIAIYTFTNRTNATLFVPIGSKAAYEAADYWKEFKEIIEIDPTGIEQISVQGNGYGNIDQEGATWYTLDGKRASEPQRGLNIIRMSNGKTRKLVVK
jgi:hypothetical protein